MIKGAKPSVLDAVGETPLVRLQRMVPGGLEIDLYVKCENLNPSGSVKDRVAFALIREAEREGRLRPGGTVIEATAGNAGAALAMASAVLGYRCVCVMPDKTSADRAAVPRAYGARVVLCPTMVEPDDPRSHYSVAKRLAEETPGGALMGQHFAKVNAVAHGDSLGAELWAQSHGEIDVLVGGMNTGGALTGAGRFLKARKPGVKVLAVDPVGSVFYDKVKHGRATRPFAYKVEGVGGDFVAPAADLSVIDDCVRVDDRECFFATRELARTEGILCGAAGGAAVVGALRWARESGAKGNVVVIVPDGAWGQLGTVFNDEWMRENGYAGDDPGLGTVREVLAQRTQSLVTVTLDDSVRTVVQRMKASGVSQVPVVSGESLVGIVGEVAVLRALVSGEVHLDAAVEAIVDADYATVTPETRVDLLQSVLAEAKVVLVTDGARLLGLISKIDLIEYLARRAMES